MRKFIDLLGKGEKGIVDRGKSLMPSSRVQGFKSSYSLFPILAIMLLSSAILWTGCGSCNVQLMQGTWKYGENSQSSLDNAARKSADSLINSSIDPAIKNVVVVGVNRSRAKDENARSVLREAIINSPSNKFNIIAESEGRETILGELEWLETGFVDPSQANKIGEALGADALIIGDIEDRERCSQRLHLLMLEVKSMKYPWEKNLMGYPNRSRLSAVAWSIIPGGGQAYNFSTTKAIIQGGLELIGIGVAIKAHLDYSDAQDKYMGATKKIDIDKYNDEADTLFKRRNLADIVPAAIFLYNIIDAYLGARKYQNARLVR